MAELVKFIAKSLVDNPDQVDVRGSRGEQTVIIELGSPDDMGKVIGQTGADSKSYTYSGKGRGD